MLKRLLLLLLAFTFFSCATEPPAKPEQNGYHVKGYIPTWSRWSAEDVRGNQLTELIISFAQVYQGKIFTHDINPLHLEEIAKLRELYPNLHITVAIGGWGADGFSDAVLTPESREIFTQSIAEYVIEKDFDGIDIDWEFPVNGGWGAIKARPEDRENHTEFLYLLREKLDRAGAKMGRYISLSVAANQGDGYVNDWVEIDKVAAVVDNIHIMTYDGAGMWSGKTEHHSGAGFTETAVKRFIDAGVPPEKIILGGAFYGKIQTGIDFSSGEPLDAPFTDKTTSKDINYDMIKSKYYDNPDYIVGYDNREDVGRSPYVWSQEKGIFITYDDPKSIADKCDIVKKYGLAGAMFWDYTQDRTGDLVGAFAKGLLEEPMAK